MKGGALSEICPGFFASKNILLKLYLRDNIATSRDLVSYGKSREQKASRFLADTDETHGYAAVRYEKPHARYEGKAANTQKTIRVPM